MFKTMRIYLWGRIAIIILLTSMLISCGMHYQIEGKVIDTISGKPIEGAVVAINWSRTKLGIPGLPVPHVNYGTFESITDENGSFSVPKYIFGHHYMGVYKTGYICWSSKAIFNNPAKDRLSIQKRRYGYRVIDKMIVKLDPKPKGLNIFSHAKFVQNVGIRLKSSKILFNEATKKEYEIYMMDMKKNLGKE
jgi:hypothetical protein